MQIDFNQEQVAQNSLDIEDIGQLSIEATNDDGFTYYLIIQTIMGESEIFTCGPVVPDIEEPIDNFSITYKKMNFNQKSLIKFVTMWLNDRTKKITDAYIIDKLECINQFTDIREYLKKGVN